MTRDRTSLTWLGLTLAVSLTFAPPPPLLHPRVSCAVNEVTTVVNGGPGGRAQHPAPKPARGGPGQVAHHPGPPQRTSVDNLLDELESAAPQPGRWEQQQHTVLVPSVCRSVYLYFVYIGVLFSTAWICFSVTVFEYFRWLKGLVSYLSHINLNQVKWSKFTQL